MECSNKNAVVLCFTLKQIDRSKNTHHFHTFCFTVPPSLVTKPSDKTIIENEEVTFHCGAIGNPVPKITWIKDGKTLRLGDTLRFTANRSHSGKYWCLAKNYLNVTVNASVNLDVQCKYNKGHL